MKFLKELNASKKLLTEDALEFLIDRLEKFKRRCKVSLYSIVWYLSDSNVPFSPPAKRRSQLHGGQGREAPRERETQSQYQNGGTGCCF